MPTWKNKAAAAAAARAYRARNREKIRAKDRRRDRLPHRQDRHLEYAARREQQFFNAMLVTFEDELAAHLEWIESLDYLDDDLIDTRAW